MNVIRCSHCGTTNRAGSNFCNRCGTDLRGDEPEEQIAPPVAPSADFGPDPAAESEAAPTADQEPAEAAEATDETESVYDPSINLWNSAEFAARGRRAPPPPPPDALADEWLDEEDEPPAPGPSAAPTSRRLITGVQGLLDPLRIASELTERAETQTMPSLASEPVALPAEQLRRIRTLLTQDPVLLDMPLASYGQSAVRLHLPWVLLLFSLLIGIPILLDLKTPIGTPQQWPGVAEAYTAINALPADAAVLLVWAYDPATAAELDLVALPLASHLLERQTQPVIISQLPGGLAVAQRLFDRAMTGLQTTSTFRLIPGREPYLAAGYLPGGAALLSLVAQDPAVALLRHVPDLAPADGVTQPLSSAATTRPALTIVVAAQAEGVQQWLEQGQPVQYSPVLAFTSAGADPVLRPYFASSQLSGLVSGFDGAIAYQQLRSVPLAVSETALLGRQVVLQNWGHFGLLLVLVLGNLAALGRGGRRG